jgi:hypothetical protein
MRQPPFRRNRLAASAAAVALVAGCGDEPTRPQGAALPDERTGFTAGAEVRGQLGAALIFAREQSLRGLERRAAAERVAARLEALAARIEANDRIGAARALADARKTIEEYRRLAVRDGGASAADLDALTLTLDHATALVEERGSSPETHQP